MSTLKEQLNKRTKEVLEDLAQQSSTVHVAATDVQLYSVSSYFTCKGEVDLQLGGIVHREMNNHLLHEPSAASSSSGVAWNKPPCSVGCYDETLDGCLIKNGYHTECFFFNETLLPHELAHFSKDCSCIAVEKLLPLILIK
eukprot:g44902.t1